MLTIEKIQATVTKIGKKYGIKRAYLFGSYAKNQANENSDADLIIDNGDVGTFKDFFHFHEELKKELGTNVDLLTEASIKPSFFERIKNDRILVYGNRFWLSL